MKGETPAWLHGLWKELDAMSDLDQITATGEWITVMTNSLLTELSARRKIRVAQALLSRGWDATRLAETVGSRRTAIERLAEEGRRLMREMERAHAVEEEAVEEGAVAGKEAAVEEGAAVPGREGPAEAG